ncbi:pentapeptide repeat-containing protein [Micromonospora sp. LAH09]|uniref:pentapeptide repeat-containing protein n=1 Tax=Micromonospora cabrerizensis TaxID=2911213 RepID=UPI001EE92FD2|nr:pentapeptide repeat-containing protein [Micromonospora cabrerizensis]MCG5471017.1 pentapeptide repeat-containing protein [Micromonospora cabrerizensis]
MAADEPAERQLRVMPWWLVLVGLLLAAALGWLVLDLLLTEADRASQPDTRATLRIDAIRTGLTVVAGTGGGLALLLAARRQWITERAQRHQESVAARDQAHRDRVQAHAESVAEAAQRQQDRQSTAAEHDAAERRLTELYTRAVDLLGNDSAAVRLGGLHALERLGQDNPGQRPTIAAVLCAYLRMPAPDDEPRETEVRRTAQRVLTRHLRADDDATYWPKVVLDLSGARLVDFDASGCTLTNADFTGTVFTGATSFADATARGRLALGAASFDDVTFEDLAADAEIVLDDAHVAGVATFAGAELVRGLSCRRSRFAGPTSFRRSTFDQSTSFDATRFEDSATFQQAEFFGGLSMEHTDFGGPANFRSARFEDMALFRWTMFGSEALFEQTRFTNAANFGRARFHGSASFDGAQFGRQPLVDQARAAVGPQHVWPTGAVVEQLDDEWLLLVDR